jgi:type I restriction enzyme S subunit
MMPWPEVRLGTLLKITHGFAFKGEYFSDGGQFILLTPGNLYPKGGLKLKGKKETYYTGNFPRAYILSKGDLVVVMTDLTQDASLLGGAMLIDRSDLYLHNQRLGLVSHTDQIDRQFLYHWLKLTKPHFELLAGGATFAELTKGTFKRIHILTPPEPIVSEFARIESPIFDGIENHVRVSSKLVRTRDMLLPRLISGKLSVGNLDIQFPPGMAEEAEERG